MNTLFLGGLPRILDFGFELDGILQSAFKNWQLRNSITLDSRPKSKRSQRDRLFRSFPARKWLRRVNTTAVGDKAFFVTLLALRVSRSGHFWRSCGRGRPPPLCSPFLRNWARGSPNHSCGSGTDLPPLTPEKSQRMPSPLCFHIFLSKLINRSKKWENY